MKTYGFYSRRFKSRNVQLVCLLKCYLSCEVLKDHVVTEVRSVVFITSFLLPMMTDISVISLTGGLVGQRMSDHPDIRKLGFTGSTPIGKQIMKR